MRGHADPRAVLAALAMLLAANLLARGPALPLALAALAALHEALIFGPRRPLRALAGALGAGLFFAVVGALTARGGGPAAALGPLALDAAALERGLLLAAKLMAGVACASLLCRVRSPEELISTLGARPALRPAASLAALVLSHARLLEREAASVAGALRARGAAEGRLGPLRLAAASAGQLAARALLRSDRVAGALRARGADLDALTLEPPPPSLGLPEARLLAPAALALALSIALSAGARP